MIHPLIGRWETLCARAGLVDAAAVRSAGLDLLARWHEPHRHYHDWGHVSSVLNAVDWLGGADVVWFAAWYHDAIYQPRAADNEQRSAELAGAELVFLGLPTDSVDAVRRLVLLTVTHDPDESDVDGAVLSDADLWVLGLPPGGYDGYVAGVRQEYAHVDDEGWRTGRSAVLRGLLSRRRIFRTPLGAAWEADARANLTRELATLRDDPSAGADQRP